MTRPSPKRIRPTAKPAPRFPHFERPARDPAAQRLLDLLRHRRPSGSKAARKFARRFLAPVMGEADAAGSFYSEGEFMITGLSAIRHEICEVGRSCVAPEFRSGAVVALLWSGLAQFMQLAAVFPVADQVVAHPQGARVDPLQVGDPAQEG